MKKHCSVLLALLLTLAMMVSTCGAGGPSVIRDMAQDADAQLQPVCEAYLRCLQENQGAIEQYNWQAGQLSVSGRSVAVTDVTGDGIPELIYMQAGDNTLVTLRIATCRDGELTWLYADDATWWDGQVGGGFSYYLFKIQGDTALYAYLYPTFESEGHIGYSRFAQTADGTLERVPVCEKIIRAEYSESGYAETVTYQVDGSETTEEGYLAKEEELKASITEVFQYSLPAGEGEAFSNRFDLQSIGRAMTYEEAVSYLQTPAGDGAAQPDEAEQPKGEAVDVASLPASLNAFLKQFTDWYWDANGTWTDISALEYDSAHAADGSSNILASIVDKLTPSCVDFSLYPGIMPEEHWEEDDPRGWSVNRWYMVYDGPTVDWVAKNIFNITDEEISALLAQGEEQEFLYREDTPDGGYQYYAAIAGGVGDPMTEVRLTSASVDGQRYFVTYDVYFMGVPNADPPIPAERRGSYRAELEYKTIDGAQYWSLYRNTSDIPAQPADAPSAAELFSQIPSTFGIYGNGAWHETVIIGADGSFTAYYEDMDAGDSGDGYDGTAYYYDIHGALTEPVQIDDHTYSFKVSTLAFDGTGGEAWIEDRDGFRLRHVFTDSSFVTEGQQLYLYLPGTPAAALPESYAYNAWMMQGADQGAALPVYAIYSDAYDIWWFAEETASALTVTGDQVNIRTGPGTEYEVIGTVPAGTTLTVTGKTDNWYQVDYNGTAAYIIEDYVTEN